ncbi:hypothetical protein NIES37_64450 [Tolypothrix tenuis PCC 7101]|uniref:DUF3352 domain-containing protein n=1 Tax=Tolypothrix tenuis PCC 7101 TaxID=231146 RepID=A0A1Z4N9L8_9CYAN|nr:hypothetical protein NIES37_64450 [Tolypothrix tenuis PCC 7101]BAZ73646.1 hypothetical protein NIES50_22120 [Aulosira laxa NIES-50]
MLNVNRQSSFFTFLVAGAIAFILFVIGGYYWFFVKSPVNLVASSSPQSSAAIFVSKFSPITVSLLVNPDKLQALEREGELSKLKTSLLAKSNIDYQEDIQPWLGNEITLAVTSLDIDREPENGQQPGYLLALATTQPQKSREFVDLLFSKRVLAGGNLATEEYEGVKLIYDNPPPKQEFLAGAVVGNEFVLFANDLKVLKDAINNVQAPDLNLNSYVQYQKATEQLPKGAVAAAFLNFPSLAKWQGLELQESTYDSEIISFVLNSKGLIAETSFLSATSLENVTASPAPSLSKPVGALQYIPTSAGLAISGTNLSNLGDTDLAKLWKQVTATLAVSKEGVKSKMAKPLTDLQNRWGINLPEDIFSWVEGEYAIALLPQKQPASNSWVFVVEQSPKVAEGIARLDAIASAKGLNVNSLSLNQQKISAWTELIANSNKADVKPSAYTVETKVQGVHTTLGNYEIFASDLETMAEILNAKDNSLIKNRDFQDSIAAIPQPNQGYIYLDWTKSQKLVERQLPILKLVEVVGKPFFENLRSLTVSSYGNDPGLLKGGVFLKLKP